MRFSIKDEKGDSLLQPIGIEPLLAEFQVDRVWSHDGQ